MAYAYTNSKGAVYHLFSKETTLKNGTTQTIYYFSKRTEANEGEVMPDAVPEGRVVSETKNGLAVLKKG